MTDVATPREAELGREGRTLVVGCGALAREIVDLIDRNGWSHLTLKCLPAILHNRPQQIPQAVEAIVERERADYEQVFVAYADCGTGGELAQVCRRLGVEMMAGPHCYAFYDGLAAFEQAADREVTAFYLTDFLVRQFDAFVWRPLGMDRHPELRALYFGNYERLIYMAQTDDPSLTDLARHHARRLGLAFERRQTGYGDLTDSLAAL